MDVKKVLDAIAQENCACGKSHKIQLPKLIIDNGAITQLPNVIKDFGAKKVFVLSDVNTFEVVGIPFVKFLKMQI